MIFLYRGNGVLTERTITNVKSMLDKLPYVVEVIAHPYTPDFMRWQNANIEEVVGLGEGCMGEEYERKYRPFGSVQKNNGGYFFFFRMEAELNSFIKEFPSWIALENPFQTGFIK